MKTLTYSPSQQHAGSAEVLVQSDECDKWPLFFSKRKLSAIEHAQLEQIIADVSYSCVATKADLNVPDTLKSVGIGSRNGSDPFEKIYYSAYKDDLICFTACGSSNELMVPVKSDTFYKYCSDSLLSESICIHKCYSL